MKKRENYNIGLDIGVASVGWCVTDENNNILKKNGKNMWGSRLFEEAKTAQERRGFRSAKRRLDRRKERINILKSLIQEDMEREFPNFFQMLEETSLDSEDKITSQSVLGIKYNLFSTSNMTDKTYFDKFPTIYHLRDHLVKSTEKEDLRLVYLALHHIIKYRGNFLYDGDFSENTKEIMLQLQMVLKYLKDDFEIELKVEKKEILDILIQKNLSKASKKEKILSYFEFSKEDKQVVVNIINSFLGYAFDLTKIFEIDLEKPKMTFSKEIENEDELKGLLQDHLEIYEAMNTIYSWFVLQDILKGETYISEAFMRKYEKYSEDLKLLKKVYKQYFSNEYKTMFRKPGTNNYVAYNGKSSGETYKKCKPEEFFNALKKKIEELPESCEYKEKIRSEIEENNFLSKLNVTDNGAIPYQLHQRELAKILNNQAPYYKSLAENKEYIMKLFEFRIPYYVGPLANGNSKWAWVIRKDEGAIRPWNFEDIVDEDATAEEFIRRMTNKCTYLLNEDVLPKQSLLYSKFCVLNELNNIRVNNRHLGKDMKKRIVNELFKTKKKVTITMLKDFLRHENMPYDNITGLSDGTTFNSNMSAYIDMKGILGKVDESNYKQCENLIYWITIFEEKKILKRKIKKEYPELSDEQINKLSTRRYTGWARLSEKLITGLKANDGESIIEKLENTSLNFMQIINDKNFGFDKQLERLMPKISKEIEYKDVEEIPTSPANKRAIWQTMCIVKEITKIMKKDPKNIYIEFARSEEQKKVMKDSRAKQLLKKYEEIEHQIKFLKDYDHNVYKELKAHQNEKVLKEKMYLYYIQNGKCLYSGKSLNIDELNKYEVDHIFPQSYRKDDSIDNKALVVKSENQRKKDTLLLADEIINARMEWWQSLLDNNLISQNKFYRLIKRKIFETDHDREKFIQRQLVETRQITKHVTNLLKNQYSNTPIFSIRAELTHNFREKYSLYKNRNVNNYHHAQDAYILSVIGNILDKNWKSTEEFKYSEYVKKYFKNKPSDKEKHGMVIGMINKYVDINQIREVMNYKDCFISRMLQEENGAFYNQTLYSPKDKPVISLKENKSVNKYGGYSGENKAYFVIFKYTNQKSKDEYQLIGIPIKIAYDIKLGKNNLEEYIMNTQLKNVLHTNFEIIKSHILKNQEYLDENNELMRFCSDSEIRSSKELLVEENISKLIYMMNKDESKLDDEEKELLKQNYENVFEYLLIKLQKEYKIFHSIYEKLKEKHDQFVSLGENDKKLTINGLINLMEVGQGNLKSIGLTDREGRRCGQNFKTDRLLKMTFIDKSVTGMYERRFRINGMENNSCK